ncbi:aldehyde dehydrogenase family protein [Novacetimonas hansenii]|uniref:aldehyde dehydrogenase family protein n=1 Tax=Novacetimonas hansenii TaxID=436 RepID=UPI00094FFF0C|nr:aldehyde dehydrogenase family protein [Novacetimonas hansenii]
MAYKTINPYINGLVATFAARRTDELEHAVTHAQATYTPWARTDFAERGNIFQHAAQQLRAQADHSAGLKFFIHTPLNNKSPWQGFFKNFYCSVDQCPSLSRQPVTVVK